MSSPGLHSSLVRTALVVLGLSASGTAIAQCPPLDRPKPPEANTPSASPNAFADKKAGSEDRLACRFDATLTRLFTARTAPQGSYHVYVTRARIDRAVAAFRTIASSSNVDGAWVAQDMDPVDAYGDAGLYDRVKVARLYLGVRAHVARGPIIENGRTIASITLVSPYPDAELTRLEPGTLIIEFRIPQVGIR